MTVPELHPEVLHGPFSEEQDEEVAVHGAPPRIVCFSRSMPDASTTLVHIRHVERVRSHRVATGHPERLGRTPARIDTVDAAVRSVTSRFPMEGHDAERSWAHSGGMKFSVSLHGQRSAPSHTT